MIILLTRNVILVLLINSYSGLANNKGIRGKNMEKNSQKMQ